MIKNLCAIAAGFGIWLLSGLMSAVLSVWVWGNSPDRYFSIALQCWVGTTFAFVVANSAKEKIAPSMSDRTFVLALGSIVLLWAASSMISDVDLDFKAIALAAHGVAILIAFRQCDGRVATA